MKLKNAVGNLVLNLPIPPYCPPIMIYMDMPVIIPVLATGYLLAIYLLLILAQRTIKSSRYVGNSTADNYTSYLPTEQAPPKDESEQWSLSISGAASLASNDLPNSTSQPPSIQEASRV